jgi:hypothetical protein
VALPGPATTRPMGRPTRGPLACATRQERAGSNGSPDSPGQLHAGVHIGNGPGQGRRPRPRLVRNSHPGTSPVPHAPGVRPSPGPSGHSNRTSRRPNRRISQTHNPHPAASMPTCPPPASVSPVPTACPQVSTACRHLRTACPHLQHACPHFGHACSRFRHANSRGWCDLAGRGVARTLRVRHNRLGHRSALTC